jgi:NAD(P)-dependent dehydrogenase (short-subunit alcohol dehydrogenase family)
MGILDKRSNLRGRKAVTIGGAGGIGKAVTMALSDSEVDVAFCDIDEPAVGKTKTEVEASQRKVIAEVLGMIRWSQDDNVTLPLPSGSMLNQIFGKK